MKPIALARPDLDFADVEDDFRAILASGRLTQGPYVAAFERKIEAIVGAPHAIATTSATTALHVSLVAAGIGPGDEVLVSDFTYPATGNVIVQVGARPVFVDCLAGRFDFDLADAAAKAGPKTKAVIVVDPFGQPADLPAISDFATARRLVLIEDAACALGAARDGRACGNWPDFGCFSFHPRKIISAGEGGAVTCQSKETAERLRSLINHGAVREGGRWRFEANGFNYRMSEIQSAMALAQLARFDAIIADRRKTALAYIDRLTGVDGVSTPLAAPPESCTFQSFVVVLDRSIDRDAVVDFMASRQIETTLGTYALHSLPAFARFLAPNETLENALWCQNHSLTLPLLARMASDDIDRVCETLAAATVECRR